MLATHFCILITIDAQLPLKNTLNEEVKKEKKEYVNFLL
jgi:hypothetical protein